jgi:hypothetical protein
MEEIKHADKMRQLQEDRDSLEKTMFNMYDEFVHAATKAEKRAIQLRYFNIKDTIEDKQGVISSLIFKL